MVFICYSATYYDDIEITYKLTDRVWLITQTDDDNFEPYHMTRAVLVRVPSIVEFVERWSLLIPVMACT